MSEWRVVLAKEKRGRRVWGRMPGQEVKPASWGYVSKEEGRRKGRGTHREGTAIPGLCTCSSSRGDLG